jgi:hypothetical protein
MVTKERESAQINTKSGFYLIYGLFDYAFNIVIVAMG